MRPHRAIGQVLAVCCLNAAFAGAADPPKAATLDPQEAGLEFQLQGEYTGEVLSDDGNENVGVQIIALGDGKFRAVGYPGGLPGEGWNGETKVPAEGQLAGEEVRFEAKGMAGIVNKDGTLTIQAAGQTLGTLKKVIRKSKTLGAKPPEGAVVLFDGTSADNFKNGRLTKDGLLQQGVTSKQTFGAFKLHMEFQLSFMPKAQGQGRSNSGVYMQGRHEVQILDSFGLEGKNNECGGIYEVKDTDINMCFPPLSWQTYDIDFTPARFDADGKKTANARITVRHNGVLIHDDAEVPKATRAAPVPEGPEPGPIYIQDHGNPVLLRNIWLVEK
jgi:hypothetical protein